MKVSFILPTIRDDVRFENCIMALFAQTLGEIEIIVVDNNPNRTSRYSRCINGSFGFILVGSKRVHYIQAYDITENQVGRLLKRGLEYATGDIICLQNDDDVAEPFKAELMWSFLHDDPDHDALITDFYNIEDGRYVNMRVPPYNFAHMCGGNYMAFQAIGWKREVFDRLEIATNYRHPWDYATLLKAGQVGIRFRKLNIATETIYEHDGQMHRTKEALEEKIAEYYRLREEMGIPFLAADKINHWERQLEKYKNTFALSQVG